MTNVHRLGLKDGGKTLNPAPQSSGGALAGGNEPPHDGGMESRVAKLEVIIPTLATRADAAELRADFHKGVNDLIKWIVGTAFVGIALFITIMAFVLNNAVPKSAPSAAPSPIIIQVPTATQAQPAPQNKLPASTP